jgi:hypothetical protein
MQHGDIWCGYVFDVGLLEEGEQAKMLRDIGIIFVLFMLCISIANASVWRCINRAIISCNTWIMWVPGGWVVEGDNINDEHTLAMTYVPDAKHEWMPKDE